MNYDLTEIKENKEVLSLSSVLKNLEKQSSSFIIKSNEDETRAIDMTKQAREIKKSIDTKRKEFTGPGNAFIKKVNDLMMPGIKRAEAIEKTIRNKMSIYRALQEKRMKESTKIDTIIKVTETAKMTYRKDWVYDIIDEKKVPVDFRSVDTIKIGQAIKNGIRKIAGVKIYEKSNPVIR